MQSSSDQTIIALDVGERRIGVALAGNISRLPSPLKTLERSDKTVAELMQLCGEENAIALVVGFPRGLDGQDTAQTTATRKFTDELKDHIQVPIYFQDEALTSKYAEQELQERDVQYNKGMVDALAATYILSDFLGEHPEV